MTKTFRDYQSEDIQKLLRLLIGSTPRCVFGVHYATGGGKTIFACALAALCLEHKVFDTVVIAVPSLPIKTSFTECSGKVYAWPDPLLEPIQIPQIQNGADGPTFEGMVAKPGIVVVTHALLVRKPELLLNAERLALFIDEAQHSPSIAVVEDTQNLMGQLECQLVDRFTKVVKFSGSPERSDGVKVLPDEDAVRDLGYLMLHGYAPRLILSRVLPINGGSNANNEYSSIPDPAGPAIDAIYEDWLAHGRVPSICRFLPGDEAENRAIVDYFSNKGAPGEIVNVYGENTVTGLDRMIKAEAADAKPAYNLLQTIVLGANRIVEGVDLPSRAMVYILGLPRSPVLFKQLLGRAMRLRRRADGSPLYPGYPNEWLDVTRLVLVVSSNSSDDATRQQHFVTLFQAITLTEGLNYQGLLGDLFRRFYDQQRRRRDHTDDNDDGTRWSEAGSDEGDDGNDWGENEGDQGDGAERMGPKATEVAETIKLPAEQWLLESGHMLDELSYALAPLDVREQRIREVFEAGLKDERKAQSPHLPEHDEYPEGVIKQLLVLDAIRAGEVDDDALNGTFAGIDMAEALLELFEAFKGAVPETVLGAYIDAEVVAEYSARAKRIARRRSLESVEDILDHVATYAKQHSGILPRMDDDDPLCAGQRFQTHSSRMVTGEYADVRCSLPELLVQRDGVAWQQRAMEIAGHVQSLKAGSASMRSHSGQFELAGRSEDERIRNYFGMYAVARYYSDAVKLAAWCPAKLLSELKLEDACRLERLRGGKVAKQAALDLFEQQGIEALRELLSK